MQREMEEFSVLINQDLICKMTFRHVYKCIICFKQFKLMFVVWKYEIYFAV